MLHSTETDVHISHNDFILGKTVQIRLHKVSHLIPPVCNMIARKQPKLPINHKNAFLVAMVNT